MRLTVNQVAHEFDGEVEQAVIAYRLDPINNQ